MALGYKGRGAPKDSEEYLIAERGNELCLNLIDADDPNYIPAEIILTAIEEIQYQLGEKRTVFVHCNEGKSRAPAIVLMYLTLENIIEEPTYEEAVKVFKEVYPLFEPANGMDEFMRSVYSEYKWVMEGEE
jgi:protein-tyrosine phosphatase